MSYESVTERGRILACGHMYVQMNGKKSTRKARNEAESESLNKENGDDDN